jgi:CheY-like chemotaxis protein
MTIPERSSEADKTLVPIMVVDDNRETIFIYETYLKGSGFRVVAARTVAQAREFLDRSPAAIILDILLEHENTWEFLRELKAHPLYREIPVLVLTVVDNEKKALAMGADVFAMKPVEREWLLQSLRGLVARRRVEKVLVIDDDEVSRYLIRGMVSKTRLHAIEAESGEEGLRKAVEEKPDLILLDIIMPDILGFEVLQRLKSNAETSAIPVIIYTSKTLSEVERDQLSQASAILPKQADVGLAELRKAITVATRPVEPDVRSA